MENYLIYQQDSDTIRQMPQNYLIAYKRSHAWICEPDLSADKKLAVKLFSLLFDFNNKYERNGLNLIEKFNTKK